MRRMALVVIRLYSRYGYLQASDMDNGERCVVLPGDEETGMVKRALGVIHTLMNRMASAEL